MVINAYGFPVADLADKLSQARHIAADARARNFPPPCMCETCVSVRNLPAVMRILAAYRVRSE